MSTEPIPQPRSMCMRPLFPVCKSSDCSSFHAVHAVTTSSVLYRWPPTLWKIRQSPVRKHSSSPFCGSNSGRPPCPRGCGPRGQPVSQPFGTFRLLVMIPWLPACCFSLRLEASLPFPLHIGHGGGSRSWSRALRLLCTPVPLHFQQTGPKEP